MPDQEQLLSEIASLKQSLAIQQRQIDQLRQSQDALQGSEEKYKTLVETLPDAVIMADLAGHATFVSQRFLELHRAASVEEFMGKTAWDYLVPEDYEKGHAYYQKTLKEGITRGVELSFFRMDGTRFPSELSSALVKDASGKAVGIINVLRDITPRQEVEESLRKSEARFRSYFEQGLIGMALSNREMRWMEINDRLCEILGYPREEILGHKIPDFVHPDDLVSLRSSYDHLATGDPDHYTSERRYIRKDGNVVYVTVFAKVFRLKEGTADHYLALFEDITERKRAEDVLRQSHDELRAIYEGCSTVS